MYALEKFINKMYRHRLCIMNNQTNNKHFILTMSLVIKRKLMKIFEKFEVHFYGLTGIIKYNDDLHFVLHFIRTCTLKKLKGKRFISALKNAFRIQKRSKSKSRKKEENFL